MFKGLMVMCVVVAVTVIITHYSGAKIISSLVSQDTAVTQFDNNIAPLPVEKITIIHPEEAYTDFKNSPPTYLKGTDIRGGFHLDLNGRLIISRSIKQRFDYFFLMTDHKTLAEIIKIISGHLQAELKGPALESAQIILVNYTKYFHQYNDFMMQQEGLSQGDVHWVSEQITKIRQETLGQEVSDAFFSKEDILRQQSLNTLANHDAKPQLSKQVDIPDNIIVNQEKTLSYVASKKILLSALNDNKSPKEIQELRKNLYGYDAALRLQKLDEERNQWKIYVQRYQNLKQELIVSGISKLDINAQIKESLKNEYQLTNQQIKRLESIDRSNSSPES